MSKLACIKLLHPGAEKDLPKNVSKGKINWNTDKKHKRKFMKLTGKYLDGDNFKEDILTFWEEWEPPSYVTRINNENTAGLPWLLHEPYYEPCEDKKKSHNTDPFIFGDRFYYCCCQQFKGNNKTALRELGPFSLILFGSCKSEKFVLDTVFVVKRYEDISSPDTKKIIYYPMFKNVTLARIFNADCGEDNTGESCTNSPTSDSCTDEKLTYRLYEGISYDDEKTKTEMFSFFPCHWEKDQKDLPDQ